MTRRKRKNTELAYSMKPLEYYYDGNDRVENKPVAYNNTKKDNLEKNQIELLFDENEYLTKKLSDGLAKILGNSKIDTVNVKIDTVNIYLEQKRKYTRRKSTTSKKKSNTNKLADKENKSYIETSNKSCNEHKTNDNYDKLYENILKSYSARKNIYDPDLEILLIANALDESDNNLKNSINYGRKNGYTNREMTPIAAAYGLKKYVYTKGIPENECKTIGYNKNDLEEYIVKTAAYGKDYESYTKIITYMRNQK